MKGFASWPVSHAGCLTVDKAIKNHMFFWYFQSPKAGAPILLWLNGGPALSSMKGLFWENGPVLLTKNITDVKDNPFSWVNNFSMLYVDNPVGVGYSFSEAGSSGHRYLQSDYTKELYVFLEQFFKMFPEYLDSEERREFYIGGQSFAGKYVPLLAHYIHEKIKKKETNMPLKGIYLGGPFFDPQKETYHYSDHLYALGSVSHSDMQIHKQDFTETMEKFHNGELNSFIANDIRGKIDSSIDSDNYVTNEDDGSRSIEFIMNSEKIRQMIHVGSKLKFRYFNNELYMKFGAEFLNGTTLELAELMNHYKVLIYTGDYDATVSSIMVEEAIMALPWKHQHWYNSSSRQVWSFRDQTMGGVKVIGHYGYTSQFCRVIVHGAGHQTPRDQPRACLQMMLQFIKNGCVRRDLWL